MNENDWSINFEWKQGYGFNPTHLFFVTDENVLIDNTEKQMKESNFNVDLATEMLSQIGIKQN